MATECRGKERQRGSIGREQTFDGRGIGRSERMPRRLSQGELRIGDSETSIREGCQLIGGELAESHKVIASRITPDADEAQLDSTQILAAEPVEHLNEDQLVGQAVVEPDDDFVILWERSQCILTGFLVSLSLLERAEAGFRHEAGTGVAPGFRSETGGRWSFI